MKKIGIINCFEVSKRCSGAGCFKAFNNKTGSFDKYKEQESQLVSFVHCNGCSDNSVHEVLLRAEKMRAAGVEVIHLSSCIRSKCPKYNEFVRELSKNFEVVGYSHGKKKGKIKNAE